MKKIIIIKLGAKGDVVRTLSVLPAIKEKYPESEITWVTKENSISFLEDNPYVHNTFSIPFKTSEKFDILYNFDIEKEASDLALKINANKKYGFYLQDDFPSSFNISGEYYLNTMFDDDLKKNNKKTYQEMMFEVAELPWKKQHCTIYLNKNDQKYAENFVQQNKLDTNKLIGIHMGSGSRWPSKAWSQEKIREFVVLANKKGYQIILFGGPEESKALLHLVDEIKKLNIPIYQNNPNNSNKEFVALINLCKFVVCSDSLALHVSLAMKKKTIGLFFCTSPNEIEGYNLLTKVVSPKLYDFFPQRMNEFNNELVNSISAEEVVKLIK